MQKPYINLLMTLIFMLGILGCGTGSQTNKVLVKMDENGIEIGGATNALTSTTPTLPSQGSRTHSVFVQLEKL